MPNPARPTGTAKWLNAALMVWRRKTFLAIADAMGLKHVIERQLVGYSLRADPERARSEDVDLRLAKTGGAALVIDPSRALVVAKDTARAILSTMLELGECQYVGHALPNRSLASRSATDLPQTPAHIRECGRLRCGQDRG